MNDRDVINATRSGTHELTGSVREYDAHFVLIGEASHGTHEFYRDRADITRLLIAEKGFNAVAVEADWPDAYRVNRYVRRTSRAQRESERMRPPPMPPPERVPDRPADRRSRSRST